MAVKKKSNSGLKLTSELIGQVNEAIADMLEKHAEEISEVVEQSETSGATINFGVDLDCSESAPSIDIKLRFSASVTDRRTIHCEDPNQPSLFTISTPDDIAKQKEREEKAKAKADKNKPKGEAIDV